MNTPRILTALVLTLAASISFAADGLPAPDCPVTANLAKALAGIAEATAAK